MLRHRAGSFFLSSLIQRLLLLNNVSPLERWDRSLTELYPHDASSRLYRLGMVYSLPHRLVATIPLSFSKGPAVKSFCVLFLTRLVSSVF